MSRLSALIHPDLTEPILEKLFKKSIYTSLAYVQTNPEFLAKVTGLHYSKVLSIKNSILSQFSSRVSKGYDFYQEIISQGAIIPSGVDHLDQLLDGGFLTGNIYELCGLTSCGKTQICLTIAVNICKTFQDHNVLYISTKNDIYAHRIIEIIENKFGKTEEIGALMQKIKICQIKCMYELLGFLHKLSKDLVNSTKDSFRSRFIIIDSLPAIFYQFLGDDNQEGIFMLNNVANILHFIGAENHMVILITNLVTSWIPDASGTVTEEDNPEESQQIQQPALGKYWAHVPNTRINVKRLENTNDCLLTILKSSSQPVGKTVKIMMHASGIS